MDMRRGNRNQGKKNRWRSSRGQSVIEIVGSLIIFVIMVSFMGGLSAYLYMQHALTSAVREGARVAALNNDLSGNDIPSGIQDVRDRVKTFVQSTAGQIIDDDDITVTPPDAGDPVGERTVQVEINFTFDNPINIDAFLTALGGSQSGLSNVNMYATATMHYEE